MPFLRSASVLPWAVPAMLLDGVVPGEAQAQYDLGKARACGQGRAEVPQGQEVKEG
jgi:hypothetical protein